MTTSPWEHEIGLRCWEGETAVMPRAHRHQDIEVNMVVAGSLSYLFGGRYFEVGAGTTALFWAAIPHQLVRVTPDARIRWLNLPLATVLPWGLEATVLGGLLRGWPIVIAGGPPTEHFEQWTDDLVGTDPELRDIALLEIQAHVRRLVRLAEPDPPALTHPLEDGAVGRVTTMARYAARHFAERISVADVAGTVHLHPRYAMTLFRQVIGMTIGHYLEQCRVAEAQRLLLTTDATTSEIAHAAGFGSVSRFYATFTNACAQSPAAYRRTYRHLIGGNAAV